MKYKCRLSGLSWKESNDILGDLDQDNELIIWSVHPVFNISTSALQDLVARTIEQPHETSLYLVGLAVFNKLQPQWKATAIPHHAAPHIAAHFERLAKLVFLIPKERRSSFPNYVIDSTNCDFSGLSHWLDAIQSVFDEWKQSGKELEYHRLLERKEKVLITLINNRFSKKPNSIANALAEWASIAAQFPKSLFYLPSGATTTVNDYWKSLICFSFVDNHLEFLTLRVDPDDLEDLIDYCEMNIPHGTTHAQILMKKLRTSLNVLNEFVRPKIKQPTLIEESGDIVGLLGETVPNFVPAKSEPIAEPKPKDFKSNADYLRAKLQWQVRSKMQRQATNSLASEL